MRRFGFVVASVVWGLSVTPVGLAADKNQGDQELRAAILSSAELQEALGWSEANLAVRPGGQQEADSLRAKVTEKMSVDDLQRFLATYRVQRAQVIQEQDEFQRLRFQAFNTVFEHNLQQQTAMLQMAANRRAATFKQFDSGQDRWNNGFHGYKGPPRPLIGGGLFLFRW